MADYDFLAHPAQLDVLGAYAKALQVNQGLNENRLFQAQQQGGQAFLNATGPNGTDYNELLMGLKANPNTALVAQEVARRGQTLSADEYNQQMKRMTFGSAGFAQILVDHNGTAPYDAVKQYYDNAVKDGHVTKADEDKIMSGFGPDPVANASVGRQRLMQNIAAQEALARANGIQSTATGPGGVLIGTNQNTQNGALSSPQQPGVQQGLSPEAGAQLIPNTTLDPTSDPRNPRYLSTLTPRSALPGMPGQAAPGRPQAGGANPYAGQPNPLLGGLPNPPETASGAPMPAGPGAPGSGITLAAPPQGQPEALAADQKAYQERTAAYNNNEANLIANYKEAYQLGSKIATGKGLENLSAARSAIVSLGRAVGYDTGSMDTADQTRAELDKVLNQILVTSPGAQRSNEALGTTAAATPHLGMNTNAMLNQIKTLYGQAKQQNAAMLEQDPSTQGLGFQTNHRTMMNATARDGFAADLMTPDEIEARVKRLGPSSPAAKAFKAAVVKNMALYHDAPGSGLGP